MSKDLCNLKIDSFFIATTYITSSNDLNFECFSLKSMLPVIFFLIWYLFICYRIDWNEMVLRRKSKGIMCEGVALYVRTGYEQVSYAFTKRAKSCVKMKRCVTGSICVSVNG